MNNLREVVIPRDGYCFPNAVRKCMIHDFYKFYTKDQLEKIVCDHLHENFEQYTAYHNYTHEQLIKEAKEFFNEGNFNRDIVDLFVHATGNALDIQLNIFRRSPAGNILELFQGNTKSSRAINLKLSGSGIYTGGNHYDALPVKYKNVTQLPRIEEERGQTEPSTSYIDLTSGLFNSPSKTYVGVDEFIDLTQSPVKVPGSLSDTEDPYGSAEEEESLAARSDLQYRMDNLDEVLSEAGEEIETD